MMILHSAPPSPFGRKVRIAADMLGMTEDIEIVATDTTSPDDRIRLLNPLGKIPALVLDDSPVLFDSAVILEYLDDRAGGGRILPKASGPRFRALAEQSLADGLMDAAVLQVYEIRFREDARREPRWVAHQQGKIDRALAAFERMTPEGERTVADIALAAALGYLDLRFDGVWRKDYPRLVAWLANFETEIPAFAATRFRG